MKINYRNMNMNAQQGATGNGNQIQNLNEYKWNKALEYLKVIYRLKFSLLFSINV